MVDRLFTCQWCGYSGTDVELDEQHSDGFWCPVCDGHTYIEASQNHARRMLLILETSQKNDPPKVSKGLKKHLSPLRYPGGKSRLIDYIAQALKGEHLHTFVEVFAGGASVGLSLLDAGIIEKLVLNDLDLGVFSFWKCAVRDPDALISKLNKEVPTLESFRESQRLLTSPEGIPTSDLAWAQLICNRLSFSGISKGGPLGGNHGTQEQLLARWNPAALKKRINHIANMSDKIEIHCEDACSLLELYAYWDERTTCFIDPPYVLKGKELYRKYFEIDDHRKLAEMLNSLYIGFPGADIIITYDDHPLIQQLYPYANIVHATRKYSSGMSTKEC